MIPIPSVASTTVRRAATTYPTLQPRLHYVLAWNPLGYNRGQPYRVEPQIIWDLRYCPDQRASLSRDHRHRIPSAILDAASTEPPVSVFRITCGPFPPASRWIIEARNAQGVTVRDVLRMIYRQLRRRVHQDEYDRLPVQQRGLITQNAYRRIRRHRAGS